MGCSGNIDRSYVGSVRGDKNDFWMDIGMEEGDAPFYVFVGAC